MNQKSAQDLSGRAFAYRIVSITFSGKFERRYSQKWQAKPFCQEFTLRCHFFLHELDLFREQPFLFTGPAQLLQRETMCLLSPCESIFQFPHLTFQVVHTRNIEFLTLHKEVRTHTTKWTLSCHITRSVIVRCRGIQRVLGKSIRDFTFWV